MFHEFNNSRDIVREKKIQKKFLFSNGARQVLKFCHKITVVDFLILNITALFSASASYIFCCVSIFRK